MELRQLKYFLSVAKNLNFTRSAAELFITQPTLSQQIAELEKEIGVQLFVRSTRKIKLTHAGTTLLGEAKIL
ncbi:MAG: transcriptional regulator AlsR family, partial [Firmicutes bacterium]|nr:transcriptional regulator AlsR family [Bacillota bacterium]